MIIDAARGIEKSMAAVYMADDDALIGFDGHLNTERLYSS
jgi:hypothetical protein